MAQTRALINLSAFEHNLKLIQSWAANSDILAMIKADAYGHGALALLPSFAACGVTTVGVARLTEVQALRDADYKGRIVLMAGICSADEALAASLLECDLLIHDFQQINMLKVHNSAVHVWLKLDSGMHRLGFSSEDYPSAYRALQALPQVKSITALQHFACADELDAGEIVAYSHQQLTAFEQTMAALERPPAQTCANSAAIISIPQAHKDIVRPGIALYGIAPFATPSGDAQIDQRCAALRPVMTLEAQVLSTRELAAGESTGYNRRWIANRPSTLAYVACGYADGYPITATNQTYAWVNGQRAPVVGRVSMDTLAVDISDVSVKPQMGEFVELWGEHIAASDVAAAAGTIAYELFTSVNARVPRIVVRD